MIGAISALAKFRFQLAENQRDKNIHAGTYTRLQRCQRDNGNE
jgi:hypothetical protein